MPGRVLGGRADVEHDDVAAVNPLQQSCPVHRLDAVGITEVGPNAKRSVLRACRRVLRPGGRTAFLTIAVPRGLSPAARRQAARAGPAAVIHHREYRDLLQSAGFVDIGADDVTPTYLHTQYAWIHQLEQAADQLAMLEGSATVAERLSRRHTAVAAIEAGLLQRWLLTAQRPRLASATAHSSDPTGLRRRN